MNDYKMALNVGELEQLASEQRKIPFFSNGYFDKSWKIFQNDAGQFIGMLIISMMISFVISLIPFVGSLIAGVLNQAFMVGYFIFIYKKEKRSQAEFGDFFEGFKHFGELFLFVLVQNIVMFPFLILNFYGDPGQQIQIMIEQGESTTVFILFLVMFIFGIIGMIFYILFSLTPFLIAFASIPTFKAMGLSYQLMKPNFFSYFGFTFVLGLLLMVSMIPCGLGLLVGVPCMYIIFYLISKDITRLDYLPEDPNDTLLDHLV